MKNLINYKQIKLFNRSKFILLLVLIGSIFGMNSCEKEKVSLNFQAELELRASQEEYFFDHNTITIDSCCARITVRSNVYNPVDNFPIHHVIITKMDGSTETVIGQHNHGGWYGGTWQTDLNYPTHPYYWIMEYCFDSPGEYCFILQLTGVNGPEPPQLGDPDPYDDHKICFEIEDCPNNEEENECVQFICWEMLAGCCDLDVVESITLEDCFNRQTTYSFGPHNVAGNYNVIVGEIISILNGVNWGGNFLSYHNCKKCLKGDNQNSEIPGFFFIGSNVRIVSINGKKDCATPPNPPDWQPISKPINDGCPEEAEDCFTCN